MSGTSALPLAESGSLESSALSTLITPSASSSSSSSSSSSAIALVSSIEIPSSIRPVARLLDRLGLVAFAPPIEPDRETPPLFGVSAVRSNGFVWFVPDILRDMDTGSPFSVASGTILSAVAAPADPRRDAKADA